VSKTEPLALSDVDKALWYWAHTAAGIDPTRVRTQTRRDLGEARGPAPKVTISLISLLPTSQTGESKIQLVTKERYQVVAGAGEVGVDFYAGMSITGPVRISVAAGPADPPEDTAAALLVELVANLPAPYTAEADPEDATALIVTGTSDEPVFASAAVLPPDPEVDPQLLTVTEIVSRHTIFKRIRCDVVWRVTFRAAGVSGTSRATSAATKAMTFRSDLLDPAMRKLGFEAAGTANFEPFVPISRDESIATLDVRFRGIMTGARTARPMRAAKATGTFNTT